MLQRDKRTSTVKTEIQSVQLRDEEIEKMNNRQTDRQTIIKPYKQEKVEKVDRQTEKQINKQTQNDKDKQVNSKQNMLTFTHTQTYRQKDRQIEMQTYRRIDRETDK